MGLDETGWDGIRRGWIGWDGMRRGGLEFGCEGLRRKV